MKFSIKSRDTIDIYNLIRELAIENTEANGDLMSIKHEQFCEALGSIGLIFLHVQN